MFFGGSHLYHNYRYEHVISGDAFVQLTGEYSPEILPGPNEINTSRIFIFGGSNIGNDNRNIILGNSGVTIDGPWDFGTRKLPCVQIFGGSETNGTSIATINGKSYVHLDSIAGSVPLIYGGSEAGANSTSFIEGGSEVLINDGTIGTVVGGSYARDSGIAYTANTRIEIDGANNIYGKNLSCDAVVYGGGHANSPYRTEPFCRSVVSGDTNILIAPSNGFTGRGVNVIFGGSYIENWGNAEILGNTNVVISGDAALDMITPLDPEKDWIHISAGSYLSNNNNSIVSNDVKGNGKITFKNITDISRLMNNTAISGQGRINDDKMAANMGFYDNSVVGTSSLIFDNVKGTTGARTFLFDEIIFKGESSVTFNRSLSQLMDAADDKETVKLIVEKGSTLRIVKDPTGDTGDPILGNAKIDGTLIVEDGMTLILNNSLEKGEGAKIEGNIVVRKVNPEEPPIKPDDVNVIPVKPETVKSVDDLPAGVPALVEKQPNGDIVVTSAKFAAAVASSDVNGTVDTNLIKSIPVFKTVVSADKTALASFRGRLDEFSSHKFKDIVLCKVIPGKVLKFAFQSLPKKIESGEFAITTADGTAVEANASPKAGVEYLISFAVADNSEYDLDKTKGNILDPAVLSVNQYRLTLSATELLLAEGQSKTLTASGLAPGATLKWESSNDKVAAIEGSGEEITVKALSAGKANITVKDGSAAVTCRVTVTKGGSGGSSGGGCNSGLAAVVLAALIPLFFRRKSKAVH